MILMLPVIGFLMLMCHSTRAIHVSACLANLSDREKSYESKNEQNKTRENKTVKYYLLSHLILPKTLNRPQITMLSFYCLNQRIKQLNDQTSFTAIG